MVRESTKTTAKTGIQIVFVQDLNTLIFFKMTTSSNLPDEVINIILSNNDINIQDIVNVSTTCKRLYNTVEQSGNKFWQRKFHERWPRLKKIYEKKLRRKHIEYKELIKTGTKCKKRLRDYLTHMNKKWYSIYKDQERDLRQRSHYNSQMRYGIYNNVPVKISVDINQQDFDFLIDKKNNQHSLNYYFLMDELTNLFEQPKRIKYTNELTNIFYGKKLLPYLKHYHLRNVWQKFINRPAKQQLLEEAAIFVMQWFQPEEDIYSYSHIETELDNCAFKAMGLLRIENPRHPIFSVSHEQFSFWKYNNIDEDQWDEEDAKQILYILCKILSKIHCIISQAIMFHGVARRLGVCCDLVRSSNDMSNCARFLIWKPKCINHNNNYDECFFYIHVSHHVERLNTNGWCSYNIIMSFMDNSKTVYRLNSVQYITILLQRMNRNHRNNIQHEYREIWLSEFEVLIKPKKIKEIRKLYNMYHNQWMDASPVITALEKIIDDDIGSRKIKSTKLFLNDVLRNQEVTSKLFDEIRCTKPKPKRRKPEIKFAVGMMVRLKNQNNKRGVIIGWEEQEPNDPLLNNYYPSPSYTILYCKNKILYSVSEDLIKPLNHKFRTALIDHKDIGKYFCQFNGFFYTPNEVMREEYEEDVLFLINKYRFY